MLWLQITRHLRVASHLSEEHSTQTAKRKALRAWRQYVVIARADSDAAFKAMSFWTGRSLQVHAIWANYLNCSSCCFDLHTYPLMSQETTSLGLLCT